MAERDVEPSIQVLARHITTRPPAADINEARSTLKQSITTNESSLHGIAVSNTPVITHQLDEKAKLNQRSNSAQRGVKALADDFDVSSLDRVTEVETFRTTASTLQSSHQAQTLARTTATAVENLKQRYDLLVRLEDGVWSGMSADPSIVAALLELDGQPPRSTPYAKLATHAPSYTLLEVSDALDTLRALPGLLQDLHARVIRGLVEPLVLNDTWRPVESRDDHGIGLETTIVPSQDRECVIQNVKTVLDFFQAVLPQGCRSLNERLQQSAFSLVLNRLLIPSLPTSLSSLPEWLRLALQAAESEASMSADDNKAGVVRSFLNEEAGQVWLQKRRVVSLCEARRVAYETWSSWASETVELNAVPHIPPETEAISQPITQHEEDDGWGFDEDPKAASSSREVTPQVDADDGNDGWDFDDVAPPPAPTPAPVQPRKVAKPREAKRLGKKATLKGARHGSPSPPRSPSPPAENSSPPVQSVVPTGRRTSNPEIPVLSETFRISMAANTVIGLAASTLDELINVLSLHVSRGLSEQLAEALDLIRASIPVAQSTSIERNPIHLIQLSNDYRYLSSKLETIKTDVEWVDRTDCARRFSTASVITLETFVAGQSAVLSGLLDHAKGFADTTNPSSFMQVEHAVLQVVTFFKNIATQLATYVDGEVYHTVLGKLVESSVTGILSSVLALEDITELESLRIGSLLSSVEALGNLFQRDHANVSTVAAFVPNWIKFGYLNELLRAKLVEITYLYDNGSLVDFNSKELGGLVRALFADSPQRATLLDKIEM
ncbi:uncharacterized protein CcaverHIS019_0603710 [Cutaneotrichosporon cavernicola]|uniref:ZW10 C-terminal helical domain-containing protein n=1 Tax=Cutaneotrichosporon cavernicola TaxID=279322 RepID=A0AA48L8H4_9TREE|nr:uncharacterized protein CcaverHIS019_0603710 [Cutaneotrichosporon cavernicola]BEI93912.1 hypothetical protein CcaverHIS019_0603710 [Cutaneotrichosporon cavernicola]